MKYKRIGIMCGSSDACDSRYHKMAYTLGKQLAEAGHHIVYGGGAKGLMKNVADGALDAGGQVDGYMPEFMIAVEWQHNKLTNLHITKDMAERKSRMMRESDATIFLPGGCGTMEEFFEWLSSKRLGMYTGPLVVYNFEGYYNPLIELLHRMEKEKFHNPIHNKMWSVADGLETMGQVLEDAHEWSVDAISYASAKNAKEN